MKPLSELTLLDRFLFGENRYRYTFQMKCRESDGLWLEDGATRIFFNTRGKNPDEVSPEVVELLRYFEHTDEVTASQCRSPRLHQLHSQVSKIKASEEIGVKYMQAWEEKEYARLEGRAEGREEGREETKYQTAINLFALNMPLKTIADVLEENLETIQAWQEAWRKTL